MFEKMIVSSAGRSERRIARYLIGAFFLYGLALTAALALSVALADPRLAIAASGTKPFAVVPAPRRGDGSPPSRPLHEPPPAADPLHVLPLCDLLDRHPDRPITPTPPNLDQFRIGVSTSETGGTGFPGTGTGPGTRDGLPDQLAVPRTEPPVPKPAKPPTDNPNDRAPLRVSGTILQGKAIERRIPDYPQLARPIHLEGQVVVEVVISPDGRVESVHAVSGHPLFVKAATDAAWGWRFQPTMIGDVPVRVTGVLTFVFKF
jgi:TonB family protein